MNKKIQLSQRLEGTRDSKEIYKVFSIDEIHKVFNDTMKRIDESIKRADSLFSLNPDDAKEIYRYQVILLESALDYYCHSVIKLAFVKMYRGEWRKTETSSNFKVNIFDCIEFINDVDDEEKFIKAIDNVISKATYMSYKDIRDCLNHVHKFQIDGKTETILEIVASDVYSTGDPSTSRDKIKDFFDELYQRRNFIAHQGDRSSVNGEIIDINKEDVVNYKNQLSKIVDSITKTIKLVPEVS